MSPSRVRKNSLLTEQPTDTTDQQKMSTISTDFPLLSEEEFAIACKYLMETVHAGVTVEQEWRISEENGQRYIVIKKSIPLAQKTGEVGEDIAGDEAEGEGERDSDSDVLECTEEESDDEALIRPCATTHPVPSSIAVEYNIVLSPTYQIPVLYFQLLPSAPLPTGYYPSLKEIYSLLAPCSSAPQIKNVGIIGGISQGEHPILSGPWWFVHPCNTVEALKEWDSDGKGGVTLENYLSVWVGLVGGAVGLWMPRPRKLT